MNMIRYLSIGMRNRFCHMMTMMKMKMMKMMMMMIMLVAVCFLSCKETIQCSAVSATRTRACRLNVM